MDTARASGLPYSGVIHAAREAIVAIDECQLIVMLNPAAEQLFGRRADQLLGEPLSCLVPERHRAAHRDHVREFDASGVLERAIDGNRTIWGLHADGHEFPLEATVSRVEVAGADGPRRLFVALLRDLSAERGLKAELEGLKQRFQIIFELAPVAIWVTEGDRIVFANRACVSLFGFERADALLGRSIYSLLREESHATLRQRVRQALDDGAAVPRLAECIRRPDGALREVEIAVAALPDHGSTTVQMVITDITSRKREALELEHSRRELQQLSASLVQAREQERRHIARELHDELGQRLTALKMGVAGIAAAEARPSAAKTAGMLAMIDETVASVRRIASDLRPLMLDDLGLNAAIEWLAREASQRMGLAVAAALDEFVPPLGEEVSISLYRMVQEALTNVARHARARHVRISLHRREADLVLTVHDDGQGFPQPWTRREGSYGLMGIRERAYILGGYMEVDNPPGGGGRIRVHLPLEAATAAGAESR